MSWQSLKTYLKALDEDVEEQGQFLLMLMQGLDVARLRQFASFVGYADLHSIVPRILGSGAEPMEPSKGAVAFCFDFVIDTARGFENAPPAASAWASIGFATWSSKRPTFS
jgi:hypothetical protein